MKKGALVLIILLVVLFGCDQKAGHIEEKVLVNEIDSSVLFRKFLLKFKPVELPYIYTGDLTENFTGQQTEESDSMFIDDSGFLCYGYLPDTTNFFTLIILAPGDDLFPVLATYSKAGRRIGMESSFMEGCGGYMCGSYCSNKVVIYPDLSISCTDTVRAYKCDSTMGPLKESEEYYCINRKGLIDKKGAIRMEKEEKINLKK